MFVGKKKLKYDKQTSPKVFHGTLQQYLSYMTLITVVVLVLMPQCNKPLKGKKRNNNNNTLIRMYKHFDLLL